MTPFNHNVRYLRIKIGLSQSKFANLIGVNRGNISTYESGANASDEIKKAIADHFNLDLSKLLTIRINDNNYESFLRSEKSPNDFVSEPSESYKKTDIIDLLISAIDETDESRRVKMIQQSIKLYGRVLEENGLLKSEISKLQKDMIEITRRG